MTVNGIIRSAKEKMKGTLVVSKVKLGKKDKREAYTRIYFFHEKETILENLFFGRRNRPQKEYRKLLPEVFKRLDKEPMEVKWSQQAGCSCGCSPGFIVKGMKGVDVFVDLKVVK
jgi:hypothetical protein